MNNAEKFRNTMRAGGATEASEAFSSSILWKTAGEANGFKLGLLFFNDDSLLAFAIGETAVDSWALSMPQFMLIALAGESVAPDRPSKALCHFLKEKGLVETIAESLGAPSHV